MPEKSISSDYDLRAYAAFRLGFFSRYFKPDVLAEGLSILSGEIHPTISERLRRSMHSPPFTAPGTFDFSIAIVDDALGRSHPCRTIYDLGAALGHYSQHESAPSHLSDVQRVWDCIRRLPTHFTEDVDSLRELVTEAEGKQDLEAVMNRVVQLRAATRTNPFDIESHKRYLRLVSTLPDFTQVWLKSKSLPVAVAFALEVCRDLVAIRVDSGTGWDKATESRNKWIYDECMKGTSHKKIRAELNRRIGCKEQPDWEPILTDNGIKGAATRYAIRKGKPQPPERRRGRPRQA